MSPYVWTSSATCVNFTGTISFLIGTNPNYICDICKQPIKKKYVIIEVHEQYKGNPYQGTLPIYQQIYYPQEKVRYLFIHFKCFLENIDKLKRLVILDEII